MVIMLHAGMAAMLLMYHSYITKVGQTYSTRLDNETSLKKNVYY